MRTSQEKRVGEALPFSLSRRVPRPYVSCNSWLLVLQVLRMMVGVNISDEQLGSIADRTIQEADQDGDSAISFTEFVKVSQSPRSLKS